VWNDGGGEEGIDGVRIEGVYIEEAAELEGMEFGTPLL